MHHHRDTYTSSVSSIRIIAVAAFRPKIPVAPKRIRHIATHHSSTPHPSPFPSHRSDSNLPQECPTCIADSPQPPSSTSSLAPTMLTLITSIHCRPFPSAKSTHHRSHSHSVYPACCTCREESRMKEGVDAAGVAIIALGEQVVRRDGGQDGRAYGGNCQALQNCNKENHQHVRKHPISLTLSRPTKRLTQHSPSTASTANLRNT